MSRYLNGDLTNLDFAQKARREFDLDAVEYVNVFFFNQARDEKYLTEMKRRADGEGVKSLLIMCDAEGALGDPEERTMSIERHHKWVEAAAYLGCHSIRVNAQSTGTWDEHVSWRRKDLPASQNMLIHLILTSLLKTMVAFPVMVNGWRL